MEGTSTTGKRSGSSSAVRSVGPARDRVTTVLVDANALFLPFQQGIRLDEEVERLVGPARLVVPASVRGELDRLVERGVEGATAARDLAGRLPTVESPGRGDSAVLECARHLHAWVVTADRALRRRLVASGISVLFPRDRSRLDLERGERVPP